MKTARKIVTSITKRRALSLGVLFIVAASGIFEIARAIVDAALQIPVGLPPSALNTVITGSLPDREIPLSLPFTDEHGDTKTLAQALTRRPSAIVFVDFSCRKLCSIVLMKTVTALSGVDLQPGRDYRLIVIGIRGQRELDRIRQMKDANIALYPSLAPAAIFLSASEPVIRTTTQAFNYSYRYDATHDQFAHPATIFIVSADGRVTQKLNGLTVTSVTLRNALLSENKTSYAPPQAAIDPLCYGLTPAHGVYTPLIDRCLSGAAFVTLGALLASLSVLALRQKRRTSP